MSSFFEHLSLEEALKFITWSIKNTNSLSVLECCTPDFKEKIINLKGFDQKKFWHDIEVEVVKNIHIGLYQHIPIKEASDLLSNLYSPLVASSFIVSVPRDMLNDINDILLASALDNFISWDNHEGVSHVLSTLSPEKKQAIRKTGMFDLSFALECERGNEDLAQVIHRYDPNIVKDRINIALLVLERSLEEEKNIQGILKKIKVNPSISKNMKNTLSSIQLKVLLCLSDYFSEEQALKLKGHCPHDVFPQNIEAMVLKHNMTKEISIPTASRRSSKL